MIRFSLKLAAAILLSLSGVPSLASDPGHDGAEEVVRDALDALRSGNKSGARSLFQRACAMNDGEGCRHLAIGLLVGDSGAPRDFASALSNFRKACNLEDAEACEFLGFCYLNGYGFPRNEQLGQEFSRRAVILFQNDRKRFARECQAGDMKRCDDLGILYERGKGGSADRDLAGRFYGKACDAGYGHGCFSWGQLLESRDTSGDPGIREKAVSLMGRGCELGDLSSCVLLATDFKMDKMFERAAVLC